MVARNVEFCNNLFSFFLKLLIDSRVVDCHLSGRQLAHAYLVFKAWTTRVVGWGLGGIHNSDRCHDRLILLY
jgi:hypothetical protein